MQLPSIIESVINLLLGLASIAGLGSLILAGWSLRQEAAAANFQVGGSFLKYVLWAGIFLTLGAVYNALRLDIKAMLHEPLPIKFFKGLITGNAPNRSMFKEARWMNGLYGAAHQPWTTRIEKAKVRFMQAEAHYNSVKAETDAERAKIRTQTKNGKSKKDERRSSAESEPHDASRT